MKRTWAMVGVAGLVILIAAAMVGPVMSDVERPAYDVVAAEGDIEIRDYAAMIIAEVEVTGERRDAISAGFRLLADYIFGNNTQQQEIAMTAPVQQQAQRGAGEKIAMTAPVQQQASGGAWKVSFVMPSQYTRQALPKPNNERVVLKEIPATRYIAIRFSGFSSNNNVTRHEKRLMQYIESNQIETLGTAKYAFYNPPWTLPFMRRNEVMVQIRE